MDKGRLIRIAFVLSFAVALSTAASQELPRSPRLQSLAANEADLRH